MRIDSGEDASQPRTVISRHCLFSGLPNLPKVGLGEEGLLSIYAHASRFDGCDCVRLLNFDPNSRYIQLDSDDLCYGSRKSFDGLVC